MERSSGGTSSPGPRVSPQASSSSPPGCEEWDQYPSSVLEEYRLPDVIQSDRQLGRGAYGAVYDGSWHGARVAIKRLHANLMRDERGRPSQIVSRFGEEMQQHRQLRHPHVAQLLGICPPTLRNESHGIVFEYLPITLRQRYRARPELTVTEHLDIAAGIASGVAYLHSRNVLHRDLTTNNVMLTSATPLSAARAAPTEPAATSTAASNDGDDDDDSNAAHHYTYVAKITDVGMARSLAIGAGVQYLTTNPGAATYMAPETQDAGKEKSWYGFPADIYTFGVTIMAMINAKEPADIFVLARNGRDGDIADMPLNHPLRPTVEQCLQLDHSLRPSAQELSSGIGSVAGAHRRDVGTIDQLPDLQHEKERLETELAVSEARIGQLVEEKCSLQAQVQDLTGGCELLNEVLGSVQDDVEQKMAENRKLKASLKLAQSAAETTSSGGFTPSAAASSAAMTDGTSQVRPTTATPSSDASESLIADDVLERMLATASLVDGPDGVVARCQRLFRSPEGVCPALAKPPEWRTAGYLPEGTSSTGAPAIHDGYLYWVLGTAPTTEMEPGQVFRVNVDKLEEDMVWEVFDLPGGPFYCGSHFFSYSGVLYAICMPVFHEGSHFIQRLISGSWEYVARLPERKFKFGFCLHGSRLFVLGGKVGFDYLVTGDTTTVHSLDLLELDEGWVTWPDVPFGSACPTVIATGPYLHVSGVTAKLFRSAGEARKVWKLDVSKSPLQAEWQDGEDPAVPLLSPGVLLKNNHLVLCGGFPEPFNIAGIAPGAPFFAKPSKDTYILHRETKRWLPLPPLSYARNAPRVLAYANRIICIGGSLIKFDLMDLVVKAIEILEV